MTRIYEPITQDIIDYCNKCFIKKSKDEELKYCELINFNYNDTDLQCDNCGVLLNKSNIEEKRNEY